MATPTPYATAFAAHLNSVHAGATVTAQQVMDAGLDRPGDPNAQYTIPDLATATKIPADVITKEYGTFKLPSPQSPASSSSATPTR